MPVVGEVLGKRVGDIFPRMLNWVVQKRISFESIVDLIRDMGEVRIIFSPLHVI